MSFDDLAARFRKQAEKHEQAEEAAPPAFDELYLLRTRILGVLIRDARQAADMSIETCAERVGVPVRVLDAWELGKDMPSLPQLELLSYTLGVPISHFWGTEMSETHEQMRVNTEEYLALRNRLIGAGLRTAREAANLTPAQLAERTGITAQHITAYERGQRAVPTPVLVSLASACNVSMSHFLENGNRVGQFLLLQEDLKNFSELPEHLRQFIAQPVNQPYLELARKLSEMGTDELRSIATSILDITL
jgi:transcriptional regulator with XRE-family HTH domain